MIHAELEYFGAADYALMVTMTHDGRVEIQHQAESDRVADRRMARLAAEIIDEIGVAPVVEQLGADEVGVRDLIPAAFEAPAPGKAVLACRCGTVLDAADMCRYPRPGNPGAAPRIARICCRECAS